MRCARGFNFISVLGGLFLLGTVVSSRADELSWPAMTFQTRPWVWWWWPGSAVDATNIARQLKLFQQAGLGGVQVTPIYGAKGWESQYLPYLSPEWMEMMDYTARETRRLGLGMDMTLGTGWCFGGPTVSNQDANASVVVKTLNVSGGGKLEEKFDRSSTQALMAFSPEGHSVDLAPKISTDGEVRLDCTCRDLDGLCHFTKAVRSKGQAGRARWRRLDAEPALSAGDARLVALV